MARTPNAKLITDIDGTPMARADWNKLVDGLDLQTYGLGITLGSGLVSGGIILITGKVSAAVALVDGFRGATSSDQDIAGLVNGLTNNIWCVRVDPAGDDPLLADTFHAGVLAFIASATPPPHSFFLGTLAVDGYGAGTLAVNDFPTRPTVLPGAVVTWQWSVNVTGLTTGTESWHDVDHVANVTFRAVSLLEVVSVTAGFTVTRLENCQPSQFGFLCHDVSAGAVTCTIVFRRTGVVA
jgi:hypothetical protein